MADTFYPKQTDYIDKLNQMAEAFNEGPYNSLPLTGGTLTGPLHLSTPLDIGSGGTGATTTEGIRDSIGAVSEDTLTSTGGASLVGFKDGKNVEEKLEEIPSITDFQTFQQAIDENDALYIPQGSYDFTSQPANNRLGKPMLGPGAMMVAVDSSNLNKGKYRYIFQETDVNQRTFGEEYLFAIHSHWKDTKGIIPAPPAKIYLDGDSTVAGAYITDNNYLPQAVLKSTLVRCGFDTVIYNRAVSGAVISQFHMTDEDILDAKCIILSFGINDISGIEPFADAYRAVLTRIRSLKSYLQTTVVIKTSNICGATLDGRDETQAHLQRQALKQLARDFQCFLFDTPAFFADARHGASGTWNDSTNPPTQILSGWMDDFHRTDPPYYDPLGFGSTVHPKEVGNMWIWGRLGDAIASPGSRANSNNNVYNKLDDQLQASYLANTYFGRGVHIQRAKSDKGFPIDGEAFTISCADGTGLQFNFGLGADANLAYRTVDLLSGGQQWTSWNKVGNFKAPVPTLVNSWANFETGSSVSIAISGCIVVLGGALKGGNTIPGSTLFTLPQGYRPLIKQWFNVPCGVDMDKFASIVILPDGTVAVNNCPDGNGLSISSITFSTI